MSTQATAQPWVEGLTIGQVLRQTAEKFPDRDAVVFRQCDYRATWKQFNQQVDATAKGLLALGLKRGDHLAVWSTNWPRWVLLQFASARVGIVLVTINPAYRSHELQYALKQSEATAIALIDSFKSSDYFQILQQVCPELSTSKAGELRSANCPKLRWVISLVDQVPVGMIGFDAMLQRGRWLDDAQFEAAQAACKPSDVINIQYTSGTTGFPKGAMLTHRNLLLNVYYCGKNLRLTERDRLCIPVPLYHCFGCVLGTTLCIEYGAAMVFPHEYFEPGATLQAVQAERCTVLYGVPTMFIAQLEHAEFSKHKPTTLRTGIMAGSPCPLEVMKRVVNEMGAEEVTIAYGQTEASPLITQTGPDDSLEHRVGTVGRPIPGVQVKIVDPESGAELGDGQQGELCAKGHCVMPGYYNMPDRTAEAIDKEGWLHTGDLAVRTKDGYYRITGRAKDMIIRGGENIYPREIEEFLYSHPAIEDVQVVGVPDKKYGEQVMAWIKLREGQELSAEQVQEFCRASLAHFKVPKYVKFVTAFPMTVTGKIQKFKMREIAIEELGLQDAAKIETA